MAESLGTAYAELVLNKQKFLTDVKAAESGFKSSGSKMVSTADRITKSLTKIVGVAGGLYAVKRGVEASVTAFIEYDTALRNVWTLTDQTWESMQRMGNEAELLGARFGKTGRESLDALYQIYSAGIQGEAGMKVLEASLAGAAAGLTDVRTMADATTTILNAYKMEAEEAARVNDVLFKIVERGKTTMPELAGSFGRLASVAAPLGVGLEDLAGALMTLTRQGVSTDEAVTAVRQAIMSLAKPSEDALAVIQSLGFETGQAMLEQGGFANALSLIAGEAERSGIPLTDLFSNIRAILAVLPLAGDSAAEFAQDIRAAENASGASAAAFEKQQGAAFDLATTMANLKAGMRELGESLSSLFLPILDGLVSALNKAIDALKDAAKATGNFLDPAVQFADQYAAGMNRAITSLSEFLALGRRLPTEVENSLAPLAEMLSGSAAGNPAYDYMLTLLGQIYEARDGVWQLLDDFSKWDLPTFVESRGSAHIEQLISDASDEAVALADVLLENTNRMAKYGMDRAVQEASNFIRMAMNSLGLESKDVMGLIAAAFEDSSVAFVENVMRAVAEFGDGVEEAGTRFGEHFFGSIGGGYDGGPGMSIGGVPSGGGFPAVPSTPETVAETIANALDTAWADVLTATSENLEGALDALWSTIVTGSPSLDVLIAKVKEASGRTEDNAAVLAFLHGQLEEELDKRTSLIPVLEFFGISTADAKDEVIRLATELGYTDAELEALQAELDGASTAVSTFGAQVAAISLDGLSLGIDSLLTQIDTAIATATGYGQIGTALGDLQTIAGMSGNRDFIERMMNGEIWATLTPESQKALEDLYNSLPSAGLLGKTDAQIAAEAKAAADKAQREADAADRKALQEANEAKRKADEAQRKADQEAKDSARNALDAFKDSFLGPARQALSSGDWLGAAEGIRAMANDFPGLLAQMDQLNVALAATGQEQLEALDVLSLLNGAYSSLESALQDQIEKAKLAGDFDLAASLEEKAKELATFVAPEPPKTKREEIGEWIDEWGGAIDSALSLLPDGIGNLLKDLKGVVRTAAEDPLAALSSAISLAVSAFNFLISKLEEKKERLEAALDVYLDAFEKAGNIAGSLMGGGFLGDLGATLVDAVVSTIQLAGLEGMDLVSAGLGMLTDVVSGLIGAVQGLISQGAAYQALQAETQAVWKAIADLMTEFLWPLAAAIKYLREWLGIQDTVNEGAKDLAASLNIPVGWKGLERIRYAASNPDEAPVSQSDGDTDTVIPEWAEPFGKALAESIMGLLESYGITSWTDLLEGAREKAAGLWEWITGKLPEIMGSLRTSIDSVAAFLDEHGLNLTGIFERIKNGIQWFIDDGPGFINDALGFLGDLFDTLDAAWTWIHNNFPTWDDLTGELDRFLLELDGIMDFQGVKDGLDGVRDSIDGLKRGMIYALAAVGGAISGAIIGSAIGPVLKAEALAGAALGAAGGAVVSGILDVAGVFHKGGIVPGPLGTDQLIMAQAGERVLTIDQQRAMAQPVVITVNVGNKALGRAFLKDLQNANLMIGGDALAPIPGVA